MIERLLLGPLVGETLPEGHREVVNGEQRVDPILPVLAEALQAAPVSAKQVSPPLADRHLAGQPIEARPPGDIAVPVVCRVLVLGGGLDLDDLGIALLADGERMNLEITDRTLCVPRPRCAGRRTSTLWSSHALRSCSRVSRDIGHIDAGDLGAQCCGDRSDLDRHGFPVR